ncbi:bleomycin hydrolase isoform X1 [Lutzomyia longipalpis]|uniref:bleomycin hydrolase isoform X1 n=1 Tax=Lutzomyia longipalpis TaxID=7200 RepID=UPI0024845D40|nr:bleomycin hydrolase isoform X1 [Lutzomyia longipalpis]
MSCCILGCKNNMKIHKELSFHIFPHPEREPFRYSQWVEATRNPKLKGLPAKVVYARYRICRRHFEAWCFNGSCKRLMKNAVPTLFLTKDDVQEEQMIVSGNTKETTKNLFGHEKMDLDHGNDVQEEDKVLEIDYKDEIEDENQDDFITIISMEDHLSSSPEIQSSTKTSTYPCQERQEEDENYCSYLYEVTEDPLLPVPISEETCVGWRDEFYKCPKNILAQNVCTRYDPFDVSLSKRTLATIHHVFTHKVENEGKPVTNQKSSGRCWNFATLNTIRIPFMKAFNLDEFEFSQSHFFYWDKIERCNYFLNNIVETAHRGEDINGRLVSFLLSDPICDGGQWDMAVNLINKYGLMPKKCFPESFSSEASGKMNAVLKSKLRQYAKELRDLVKSGQSDKEVQQMIQHQMKEIYNVVGICLGIPAETFTWEFYDKSKVYHKIGPITSRAFYEEHVKPIFNVDDKVCLVTDPRPTNPYGQVYTVDCLGNVVGGRPVLYNNQPVELLIELVTNSIKNGDPVWFGCEVSKRFAGAQGIEDLDVHDFNVVFGVDIQVTLNKADRLLYGESAMTHAMTFTGVSVDEKGVTTKFRVENSWGDDRGEKGYLMMTAEWFKEFVFEVVVDKTLVPPEVLKVFDMKPIVLPAWDPMGNLATN